MEQKSCLALPPWHTRKMEIHNQARGPAQSSYTLKDFDTFMAEYLRGNVTPEDLRKNFAAFTQAKDQIKVQLAEQTVRQLKQKLRGLCPPSRKADMVIRLYDQMEGDFAHDSVRYGMHETFSEAVAKQVAATTEEDIRKMAAQVAERTKELKERRQRILQPETLSDFEDHKRIFGSLDRLEAGQRRKYDELKAEDNQARRAREVEERAKVAVDMPSALALEIVPGYHTKRQEDIWIVTLSDKVDRDTFLKLNQAARRIGGPGWTRKYGDNPAGFQFRTYDMAEKFLRLQHGEVSVKDRMEERKEERLETTTGRLLELADRLEARAKETLDAPRKTNTVRRADMASAIEDRARAEMQFAETLRALAEAARDKELTFISRVTASTQVQTLDWLLRKAKRNADEALIGSAPEAERNKVRAERWELPPEKDDIDHAEFPHPWAHCSDLRSVCASLANTPGAKLAAKQLLKLVNLSGADRQIVTFKSQKHLDYLGILIGRARRRKQGIDHQAVQNITDNARHILRLEKMGIEDLPTLRAALREYFDLRADVPKADPAVELERNLVQQKVGIDFFPTPPAVIDRMMEALNPWACHTVLEPSAGKGDIAAVLRGKYGSTVHCCEISGTLRELLKAKGFESSLVGSDFLEYRPEKQYERIAMNPPWGNGAALSHVQHAYQLLAPGGRLVAVIGNGFTFREDRRHLEFREWTEGVDAEIEELGSAFDTDESFRRTSAKAVMLTIVKPCVQGEDDSPRQDHEPELPPQQEQLPPLGQLTLF